MPKTTFLNLAPTKKDAINDILIKLYATKPASLVTVSEIVQEADFSRAAFYKYFVDIEDAHQYIIRYTTDQVHRTIMKFLTTPDQQLFTGLRDYLVYVTELPVTAPELRYLALLTKNGNTIAFKPDQLPTEPENHLVTPWLKILAANEIKITNQTEAIAFLYFLMELTMTSVSYYISGSQTAAEMLQDFNFKIQWLEHGIK